MRERLKPNSNSSYIPTSPFIPGFRGFKLYMLSGDLYGESATISAIDNNAGAFGKVTLATALTGTPANGDLFCVAPIRTKIVWPQLEGSFGVDVFESKTLKTEAGARRWFDRRCPKIAAELWS